MTTPAYEVMVARAREVGDQLRGSGKSLHDVASDEEMQDTIFCAELDSHVFCCSCCDWWCAISEMSPIVEGDCNECEPGEVD